jgi:hypothetical protein
MHRLLMCLILAAAGASLAGCGASEATAPAPSAAYEPRGSIERAPLAPPAGYGSAPMPISPQPAGIGTGTAGDGPAPQGSGGMTWKASPRWAEVRGNDKIEGEQDN